MNMNMNMSTDDIKPNHTLHQTTERFEISESFDGRYTISHVLADDAKQELARFRIDHNGDVVRDFTLPGQIEHVFIEMIHRLINA